MSGSDPGTDEAPTIDGGDAAAGSLLTMPGRRLVAREMTRTCR